jgi:hypothetical protein
MKYVRPEKRENDMQIGFLLVFLAQPAHSLNWNTAVLPYIPSNREFTVLCKGNLVR